MIVIKIELWPGGCEARKRQLADARIANVSNLAEVSDYMIEAREGQNELTLAPP
jgi:hypothetical protein